LTNIYAPCTPEGRNDFLNWFHDFDMEVGMGWLIIGDSKLIRRQANCNRPGGNIQGMVRFNATIKNQRLEEL
jgi:hypothetical protein